MLPKQFKSDVTGLMMILVVFNQLVSHVIEANAQQPFLINPQTLQPSQYITVTGCNNDCDIACCYCDITLQPPLCVQCCKEDP
ncbi:hypothetical protein BUALT_Bualt04G0167200 [Buddleja alternifolia]|uniref:Uncharacterized protein n=1 Tax=Buddleja alternifolia TaxID=168488 RepID=A0AAV6XQU3_9LAMI|nr:hypothetical protein BUALT_Bualt04G0167200 [Buddleja alternifolia]